MKFATCWKYPIFAIFNAIEKDNSIMWYAVEENCIYVSRFYWSDGVQESISIFGCEYEDWYYNNEILMESIEDSDYHIWYYMDERKL